MLFRENILIDDGARRIPHCAKLATHLRLPTATCMETSQCIEEYRSDGVVGEGPLEEFLDPGCRSARCLGIRHCLASRFW